MGAQYSGPPTGAGPPDGAPNMERSVGGADWGASTGEGTLTGVARGRYVMARGALGDTGVDIGPAVGDTDWGPSVGPCVGGIDWGPPVGAPTRVVRGLYAMEGAMTGDTVAVGTGAGTGAGP